MNPIKFNSTFPNPFSVGQSIVGVLCYHFAYAASLSISWLLLALCLRFTLYLSCVRLTTMQLLSLALFTVNTTKHDKTCRVGNIDGKVALLMLHNVEFYCKVHHEKETKEIILIKIDLKFCENLATI